MTRETKKFKEPVLHGEQYEFIADFFRKCHKKRGMIHWIARDFAKAAKKDDPLFNENHFYSLIFGSK